MIASGKTRRDRGDRVKTDRKDAELLARLLLDGQLSPITVPPVEIEAARPADPAAMTCVIVISIVPGTASRRCWCATGECLPSARPGARSTAPFFWLVQQQFDLPTSELVYADLLACVDGLSARKPALSDRLSNLAVDERWWPTVARLRAFRGIDTLTALALHLEFGGDWQRFTKARRVGAWLGLTPSLNQAGESARQGALWAAATAI